MRMAANATGQPNPGLIFETMNRYQHTMALVGAIELEIFTHIADGATSAAETASPKGYRIASTTPAILHRAHAPVASPEKESAVQS
jgi:hypothetical protein